jgi:hypothetical protein
MPVGIDDIDLRISGSGLRLDLHLVEVAIVSIFPIALGAQEFKCSPVTGDPHRKMNIARIDSFVLGPERSVIMHDEMQMLSAAHLKPGARKGKRRPCDFFQAEDVAIKFFRPIQIGDGKSDVVQESDFHEDLRFNLGKQGSKKAFGLVRVQQILQPRNELILRFEYSLSPRQLLGT